MKRYKRLYILLGVLCVICLVTFAVSRHEEYKEQIAASDEIILEIPTDSVQSLSWEYDDQSLSFHRDESWLYDEDEAFPVDEEKMTELLDLFSSFGVSFIIEDAENLGQYGLDDPACTIRIDTEEESYTITLGDFSTMDSQRYVSIGDGNVYLVSNDPMDAFSVELKDMIDNDEVPAMDAVTEIQFTGSADYTVTYEEDNNATYREADVYFTRSGGEDVPLDTGRVEDYLDAIQSLDLTNYVTYNATEEELSACGLDNPELTVEIDYTAEDEEGNETSGTFLLSVSRDPEELAAQAEAAETETETSEESEEEEITAYVRVGDSPILYQITGEEYEALMAASYDDLRHTEVLPADFADISQFDITIDGEDYTITAQGDREERTYTYQEEEVDLGEVQSAIDALQADSFTDETPTGQEELSLTVHLELEGSPTVHIQLYRYDGTHCVAVVDGEVVSLVPRSAVVDLQEAVNAIVLN